MARHQTQTAYAGKLVDTWTYEYEGIADSATAVVEDDDTGETKPKQVVEPIKVKVELRIHKKFKESATPPLQAKEVWFTVECPERKLRIQGADIEALRAAMWGQLDAAYKVKWESYFLVEVAPHRPFHGEGTGIEFRYDRVQKGTAFDGTLLLRKFEHRDFKIDPWPGEFRDKQNRVMACIPATDENEAALQEFAKKIDAMRKLLADFLRPDQIMQTLGNLAGIALLGAPAKADDDLDT